VIASEQRPLLRGALHQAAFSVALVVGALLIAYADRDALTRTSAAIFAGSVVAMLGASALYHRITWSPRARPWLRRIDHAGIYLLIAGSYTPVGLLALHGWLQRVVLGVVWIGAGASILLKFAWVDAPKWLAAALGLALGWVGVAAMPEVWDTAGGVAVVLLAVGGLAYTAGALVYAFKRPNPSPRVFGYHELFHAFTLVAVACQYVAIAFYVLKVG
jgi:hemolysin III